MNLHIIWRLFLIVIKLICLDRFYYRICEFCQVLLLLLLMFVCRNGAFLCCCKRNSFRLIMGMGMKGKLVGSFIFIFRKKCCLCGFHWIITLILRLHTFYFLSASTFFHHKHNPDSHLLTSYPTSHPYFSQTTTNFYHTTSPANTNLFIFISSLFYRSH